MSLGHPNVAQYVVTINSYIKKKGETELESNVINAVRAHIVRLESIKELGLKAHIPDHVLQR